MMNIDCSLVKKYVESVEKLIEVNNEKGKLIDVADCVYGDCTRASGAVVDHMLGMDQTIAECLNAINSIMFYIVDSKMDVAEEALNKLIAANEATVEALMNENNQ